PLDFAAALEDFGLLESQTEFALQDVSVLVAAHRDVAGEDGIRPAHDVDAHEARADVEQHDDLIRLRAVADFVGVLHGERIHIHDGGGLARLRHHLRQLGDDVLLAGHQQHFHIVAFTTLDHVVVEVDVVNVEGDVLFGLPLNLLAQLLVAHHRHADLLDDDGMAGNRSGDLIVLDPLIVEDAVDAVRDVIAVNDLAVHDGVGHQPDLADADQLIAALAAGLQFDDLDPARTDVEPDESLFAFPELRYPGELLR